jgi:hypothetical protein
MRAIYIDAFNKELKEIDLPNEPDAFLKETQFLLKTDNPNIIHSNELLTVLFDKHAASKDSPSFWSGLMEELPLFGNVICVGRNPITQQMEDLHELYKFENFQVKWCDEETTERFRKTVVEYANTIGI